MFTAGFEKTAFVVGALIGSAAGGEHDKKTGGKKHRLIGALRGAVADAAAGAGGALAGQATAKHLLKRHGAHFGADHVKMIHGARVLGTVGGGIAGYKAIKALGPKYDKELKSKHK